MLINLIGIEQVSAVHVFDIVSARKLIEQNSKTKLTEKIRHLINRLHLKWDKKPK